MHAFVQVQQKYLENRSSPSECTTSKSVNHTYKAIKEQYHDAVCPDLDLNQGRSKVCGREVLVDKLGRISCNYCICRAHFEKHMLLNYLQTRLQLDAEPTVFPYLEEHCKQLYTVNLSDAISPLTNRILQNIHNTSGKLMEFPMNQQVKKTNWSDEFSNFIKRKSGIEVTKLPVNQVPSSPDPDSNIVLNDSNSVLSDRNTVLPGGNIVFTESNTFVCLQDSSSDASLDEVCVQEWPTSSTLKNEIQNEGTLSRASSDTLTASETQEQLHKEFYLRYRAWKRRKRDFIRGGPLAIKKFRRRLYIDEYKQQKKQINRLLENAKWLKIKEISLTNSLKKELRKKGFPEAVQRVVLGSSDKKLSCGPSKRLYKPSRQLFAETMNFYSAKAYNFLKRVFISKKTTFK